MKDWNLLLQPRYCYWNMDAKEATCRAPQGHHCSEGGEGQWGKLVLNSEFSACSPPGCFLQSRSTELLIHLGLLKYCSNRRAVN